MSKKNINSAKSNEQEYEFICPVCGGSDLVFVYDASVHDVAFSIGKDSAGLPVFKPGPDPKNPECIIRGEVDRCYCYDCKETWYDLFDIPLKRVCKS